ncbi:MAG: PaaI family thioesterase [Rhizobiaceae bacterium]|nr:PaaI family thioesterase [Rhizobiaceae bacterium]MCV0404645.1 PaaI family thioesterase [Rhizobiaceae bacterium]
MRDVLDLINALPFVRNHAVSVLELGEGMSVVSMPFDPLWSTPPDLFPTAMVGLVGDVAAISACFTKAPSGHACATLDFTVKNTGLARGEALRAEGRVLMAGKTVSVGAADVYVVRGGERHPCGTVLATARVYAVEKGR